MHEIADLAATTSLVVQKAEEWCSCSFGSSARPCISILDCHALLGQSGTTNICIHMVIKYIACICHTPLLMDTDNSVVCNDKIPMLQPTCLLLSHKTARARCAVSGL
jgi:hypothetical protein